MKSEVRNVVEAVARRAVKPRILESVWQWAERHVRLSVRSTGTPGPYSSAWIAYTRKWQECFTDSRIREIIICAAAQTGKTESVLNCLRYSIAEDPGPMLWIMPAETLARSFSETRLQPSLRDCPPCREQIPSDPDLFKLTEMHFKDCTLTMVGAGSAAQLSSRPIRFLFADEIDKFPEASQKEAGALELVRVRTTSFWNAKIILASTPTVESGQIWQEYLKGSQHKFYVKCPQCGVAQVLRFKQVKWPENEITKPGGKVWNTDAVAKLTWYECESCQHPISQLAKAGMIRGGEWRATNSNAPVERISFHLSALYSPWRSWGSIAAQFLEAKGSYSGLQNFTNSVEAEPWKVQGGENIQETNLEALRGDYNMGVVPVKPELMTMCVDVQRSEFWYTIRAWVKGGESWLIDYGRVPTFEDLTAVFRRRYPIGTTGAEMGIYRMLVDSGFNSQAVYEFCLRSAQTAYSCKGWEHLSEPVKKGSVMVGPMSLSLWHFDTTSFKNELYVGRITDQKGPPWHLPRNVGADYISQMTAERLAEKKNPRGAVELVWTQCRRDNHLGDCEIMQLVAASLTSTLGIAPWQPKPGPVEPITEYIINEQSTEKV